MSEDKNGMSRRGLLKGAGGLAAGAALLPQSMRAASSPGVVTRILRNQDGTPIAGSDIEVGVLYEDGAWFNHAKSIGDQLEKDYPGTKVKYTFANTASDSARALRWQNGDPLDVDTGRWLNPASTTWDWVNNGFVYNMTSDVAAPLADGTVWKDTFLPSLDTFTVDSHPNTTTPGAYWGVPYETVLMLMQYNMDHFDTAGVKVPTTWAEFLDVCTALKAKGIQPICVSGPTAPYCAQWWDRLTQRIVGLDAVKAVAFGDAKVADNPGFLTAATELAKFKANDWFMEGYDGADFTTAQALFFQGKAAIIHMGSWLSTEMTDVIAALPKPGFRLGVFDFPQYEGGAGDQKAGFGTAQIWSVANPAKSTSHTVNVPLAVEYLKRWTNADNEAFRSQNLKMIPTIKGVATPPGIDGLDAVIASTSETALITYYYGIHWDTNLSTAWWNPIQALFLGQSSPEEAIKALDDGLDQYRSLKKAGG